jgi:NADPH:quinone reductase
MVGDKNNNMSTENVKNRKVTCHSLHGPDALSLEEDVLPPLGAGEFLIEVKAAALNFPDVLMTMGKYQFKPKLPFTLGMEGSGLIKAAYNPEDQEWVGQRIIFKGKTGACAKFKVATQKDITLIPANLSFEEAAAFAVTFQTAYVSLAKRGKLTVGETVLVHGSGGGVGQASVAVAKAMGATVIATASTTEKLKIAQASGADYLINYKEDDFVSTVLSMTNQKGVDLILDPVGGEVFSKSVEAIAWGGRILTVGFASGDFGNAPLDQLQQKGGSIVGVRAGEFGRKNPPAGIQAWTELSDLTEKFDLKPVIGNVWSLDQVPEALLAMQRRQVLAKQVVTIG